MPVAPEVSVVIPVFNRAHLLPRAILSVLKQSFEAFEVLVVDDGSTEDLPATLSIFDDARLRMIRHEVNRGSAAARNTGISEAKGRLIALLDSDDIWRPEKLERQLAFMGEHGGSRRVSCTAFEVYSSYYTSNELRYSSAVLTRKNLELGCRVSPGSTMVAERSLFEMVGPYCEDLHRLEDWDWLLRCTAVTDLAVLDQPLSIIDASASEMIDYPTVARAVALMKQRHFRRGGLLPTRSRLKFLATLENELAATAYRSGRYGTAFLRFLRSHSLWPVRKLDYYRRIGTRVLQDRRKAAGPQDGATL